MKKAFSAWMAGIFLLLSGCSRIPQTNNIQSEMVTEITITCETCNDFTRRYYNTGKKMQPILLFIRKIGHTFSADTDPELLDGNTISIVMTCADQTRKVYRIKDNRYFQAGSSPWQQIDPEKAGSLWKIILATPSDPEKNPMTGSSVPRYP